MIFWAIKAAAVAIIYYGGSVSGGYSKFGSPLIGLGIGLLVGVPWEWLPAAALAGFLGEKHSPAKWSHGRIMDGTDGGPDEAWRKNSWSEIRRPGFEYFNLATRGAINFLFWAPFFFLIGFHILPVAVYIISWPLGAYTGRGRHTEGWHDSEKYRQLIMAAFLFLVTVYVSNY